MRDDSATPEMEPASPYAYEAPKFRERDPYKESRRGSLADRTAHLFENDQDDGVEDMAKWEEENLDSSKIGGPILMMLKITEAQSKEEEKPASNETKEDKEEKNAWKMAVKTAKAEAKVAERWPNWRDDANCEHDDVEKYFPSQGESTKDAKENCASCKAAHACLLVSIEANYVNGIWGGMTNKPRKQFARVLKAGGTWDDIIDMREEGIKDEDQINITDAKKLADKKIAEVKKRGQKPAKPKPRKTQKAA